MRIGMYGVSTRKMLAPFLFITVLVAKQEFVDPQDCVQFTQRALKNNGVIDCDFFPPKESYSLQKILVGLIEMEQTEIRALMFRLTNQPITDALVRAKKRGVKIELVVDSGALALAHYSRVHRLTQVGVPLYVFQPAPVSSTGRGYQSLMHQKTLIFSNTFGRQVVATGSLNFTYAAFNGNAESVSIRNNRQHFDRHYQNFSYLVSLSHHYETHQYRPIKTQRRSYTTCAGQYPISFLTLNRLFQGLKKIG